MNTKILAGTGGVFALFLFLMTFFTYLKWITIPSLIIFIVGSFVIIIIIGAAYYLSNKKREIESSPLQIKQKTLNSTTVLQWINKYMIEHYCDSIEVLHNESLLVGKGGKQTPLIYIKAEGHTTYKNYHILIDTTDPDGNIGILVGNYSENQILKKAENLALHKQIRAKRITKRRSPEGHDTEIEEDITNEEYDAITKRELED